MKTKTISLITDALTIARRELQDFYTDKQSEALKAINKALKSIEQEDSQHRIMKVWDIDPGQLPARLIQKLKDYEPYTYMDANDLQEHLYSHETIVENFQSQGIMLFKAESEALDKVQTEMNENDCAYFRIVKF